jgi:twitching motility protein PilT
MSPTAAARAEWSRRLARALISGGYVQENVLTPLLTEATDAGMPLGTMLISRGVTQPPVVVNTLAQLARLPAIDLSAEPPSTDAIGLLPAQVGMDHGALAVRRAGNQLIVAFGEPPEVSDVRSLGDLIGYELVPALGDPVAIHHYLSASSPNGDGATAVMPVPPPDVPQAPQEASSPTASQGREAGPQSVAGRAQTTTDETLHVDDLLRYAVSIGASDLHLTANMPPTVRLHGALRPMEDVSRLDNTGLRDMIFGILPQTQRERFEAEHELDTSHTIPGVGRFRVNIALQRGTVAVALRPIPHEIPEFGTLGLPESIRAFTDLRRGLVLVTGPTGSGKSTSLASMIDIINRTKPLHIVTVEDPIEFLHGHKRSIISQREVGADTTSFSEALRRVLRQDPDVILVGELRDLETISTALTAAETGHLVFATLHTQDAPATIDRVIDVFPPNQQDQIRIQLGSSLQGVVTQQLVPTADGSGRCVACEVLVCTPAIQNLIRGAKTHQIYSLMQTGGQFGMQTMDQSLAGLVRQNIVTQGVAMDRCKSEEDFRNHLHGI